MENDGLIERLAHGIYSKPKKDYLLSTPCPNIEEIAKREKSIITNGYFIH
ncbi:hypothetical protein FM107_16765 [Sphingobacterium sp. JB170]|nr:hypothetical protein FM107_16765 [Sphingobacterium sp. JB170]